MFGKLFRSTPRTATRTNQPTFKPAFEDLERREVLSGAPMGHCTYPVVHATTPAVVTPAPYAEPVTTPATPVNTSGRDFHTRAFDYTYGNIGVSIPGTSIGASVQVTQDRYGEWYLSAGGGAGKSTSLLPVSASWMGGTLHQSNDPSPADIRSFLQGTSTTVSGGFGLGGGYTVSDSPNPGVAKVSSEVGLTTPQVGVGRSDTTPLKNDAPPAPVPAPVPEPTPVSNHDVPAPPLVPTPSTNTDSNAPGIQASGFGQSNDGSNSNSNAHGHHHGRR